METNQQKTWAQLATECALAIERGEQVAVAPVLIVERHGRAWRGQERHSAEGREVAG